MIKPARTPPAYPDAVIENHLKTLAEMEERSLGLARCTAEIALAEPAREYAEDDPVLVFIECVETITSLIRLDMELAARLEPQAAPRRPANIRQLH
jgi:hypothetical protein